MSKTRTLKLVRRARVPQQDGEGIKEVYESVKKKASDILLALTGFRTKASPKVRAFMQANGAAKITSIKCGRKPVEGWLDTVTNLLSLGKFNERKKELGYDKMFHLFLIINLDNGKTFKLEKNETVVVKPVVPLVKDETQIDIKTPVNTTLAEFIAKGEKEVGPEKYWIYDAIHEGNCQYFVKANLVGNKVWDLKVARFVLQNAAAVIQDFPWYSKFAKGLTDAAHKVNIVLEGEGKKHAKKSSHAPRIPRKHKSRA